MSDDDLDTSTNTSLPDVGTDLTPSNEMIVEGNVGNGSYDKFTPQLTKRIRAERKEMKLELAKGRREAYEDGMKDALTSVAKLQTGLIEQGNAILKRLQEGKIAQDELTVIELGTLKLANTAAKEAADRAAGKAKATTEVTHSGQLLHLLMGKVEHD